MKLRKVFRNHAELSVAGNAVENLLMLYPRDATLGDIDNNVEENSKNWEGCNRCNGAGTIKMDVFADEKSNRVVSYRLVQCPECKGKRWIMNKNRKKDGNDEVHKV